MPKLFNDQSVYGWPAVMLHWLLAVMLIGLFFLGDWMMTLDYYSPWYQRAPWWHIGLGGVAVILMLLRWCWRLINVVPSPDPQLGVYERRLVLWGQWLFYGFVITLGLSGYLIITAEGKPLALFEWFSVPALPYAIEQQEDIAGLYHEYLAWGLMILVLIHSAAALGHHFYCRDQTLLKMFGIKKS